jgi:hypothetical protein
LSCNRATVTEIVQSNSKSGEKKNFSKLLEKAVIPSQIAVCIPNLKVINANSSGLQSPKWDDSNYDYDDRSISRINRFDYSPKNWRFIKMIWSEHDKSAQYTLKFNSTRRGLWIGMEPPRGKRHKQNPKDLCCLHRHQAARTIGSN